MVPISPRSKTPSKDILHITHRITKSKHVVQKVTSQASSTTPTVPNTPQGTSRVEQLSNIEGLCDELLSLTLTPTLSPSNPTPSPPNPSPPLLNPILSSPIPTSAEEILPISKESEMEVSTLPSPKKPRPEIAWLVLKLQKLTKRKRENLEARRCLERFQRSSIYRVIRPLVHTSIGQTNQGELDDNSNFGHVGSVLGDEWMVIEDDGEGID